MFVGNVVHLFLNNAVKSLALIFKISSYCITTPVFIHSKKQQEICSNFFFPPNYTKTCYDITFLQVSLMKIYYLEKYSKCSQNHYVGKGGE